MIDDPKILAQFMNELNDLSDMRDYLVDGNLKDQFNLTESGTLNFHWANWDKTCKLQKAILTKESSKLRLKELQNLLSVLKEIDVYVRIGRTDTEITLYDLYEGFIDSRIRMTWFSREDEIQISTHHQAGPYITLSSMKWFNKDIYASFMFRKILTQNVPHRNFRIGLDIPVNCRFDCSPLKIATLTLHQINDYGILLKVDGDTNLTKLVNSDELELFMDLEPFRKSKGKKYDKILSIMNERTDDQERLERLLIDSDVMTKYGNTHNISSSNAKEFFLFVPFAEIHHGQYTTDQLMELFKGLMENMKTSFEKQIKKVA